jgi:hypothetical protein
MNVWLRVTVYRKAIAQSSCQPETQEHADPNLSKNI